eukprot:CAMPEP_0184864744 /NCGR_PEP_ID=MMETSP0580-20130426/15967_1 /TAXON_ID=1118495 /ORGANISM="Dactyliosolen fragilissimus" /LENGTH=188 /DNA_ID=CAMNT_0027363657 /DNA_START=219 /DNA_END=785 /DNA_ORIENTATION=-
MSSSNTKVVILSTEDGSKHEVNIPLTATLDELKTSISKDTSLGPLGCHYQRLFHLGRELKSGRRSLSMLGIGKFDNYLLHLLSTKPKTFELSSDDEENDDDVVLVSSTVKRKVEIDCSSSPGKVCVEIDCASSENPQVVDLLELDVDEGPNNNKNNNSFKSNNSNENNNNKNKNGAMDSEVPRKRVKR